MKKNWLPILSIGLNIVLLFTVYLLSGDIKNLRSDLENDLRSLENTVERELSDAVYQVRNELDQAARLHTDYGLEPTGLDAGTKSLLAEVFAELKTWGADTSVTLLMTQGGEETTIPMTHAGSGRFEAPVSLSTESGEIWLSLLVTAGGSTTREDLGGWGDVSMLLPLQMNGWGWSDPQYKDGTLVLGQQSVSIEDLDGNPAHAQECGFCIYINEEWTMTGGNDDAYGSFEVESMTLEDVALGDEVSVSFVCRDEYGLRYEFPLYTWTVVETEDQQAFTAGSGSNTPILTWEYRSNYAQYRFETHV